MNTYLLLFLRILHISGGVLWVGAAAVYFAFIHPTVKSLGPTGGQFMQHFMNRQKYPIFMSVVSLVTVLSGGPLYYFISGGLRLPWIGSGPGTVLTIGSVVAIVAFFMGFLMMKPRAERMNAISNEIGKAGGPPRPGLFAEMQKLDNELLTIERVEFVFLTLAMLAMATARYWNF